MFKRLILDDHVAFCTMVAFFVVATIFLVALWRSIRMPRQQADALAALPFETNDTRHDPSA